MSKKNKAIVIAPNVAETVKAIDELSMANDMAVVKDHHICYGTVNPLCGQPLGKKGIIKDKAFITCPECLEAM